MLRQQQQQALTQQQQFFTQAAAPDPLTERLRASRLEWLDATEGRSGPLDVSKLKGMAPYLDLYNRGRAKREGERVGIGALQMGVQGQNPELAARIAEQRSTEREQESAGAFENAFRLKNAEMTDSVMPLIGMQTSKDMGLASLASGNSNAAQDRYLQYLLRPRRQPFWQQALMGGMQAGAGMATAAGI
jgi:hypothetical protein